MNDCLVEVKLWALCDYPFFIFGVHALQPTFAKSKPNNMKTIILLIAITVTTVSVANAQRQGKTRFSIGPELGYASTNPYKGVNGNKGWGLGIGASAEVEHFFQQNLSGIFHVGFVSYAGRAKDANSKNKAYTAIPVTVGGNAYMARLHVGALIGVGLNSLSGTSVTTFAYTPQIGYNFSRNEKPLDLTLKYDGYAGHGGFGAVGLRLSLFL